MAMVPRTEPAVRVGRHEPDTHRAPPQSTTSALAGALDRIEDVLQAEETILAQSGEIDLQDINRRKNHSLLELTRLSRIAPREGIAPETLARVEAIRDRLKLNQETLQVHLAAAQEISRVLTVALGDAESDGTYSRTVVPQSRGER